MTGQRWCILRTAGPRTLPLSRSLTAAGFNAWTPTETVERRIPRSKLRNRVERAIVPTFVFVDAREIVEVARLLTLPVNPHPPFSIFRPGGKTPEVTDESLSGFRNAEASAQRAALREAKKGARHSFAVGDEVRVVDRSFLGMAGLVTGGDDRYALVSFGGGFAVKVSAFLLRPIEVEIDRLIEDSRTSGRRANRSGVASTVRPRHDARERTALPAKSEGYP